LSLKQQKEKHFMNHIVKSNPLRPGKKKKEKEKKTSLKAPYFS